MDFIILNTSVDPTNDLVVRQALAHAIDVDELVKLFGAGIAKPNPSLFPPGSPYRAADNGYPKYDLAKAKALVAQAAPNHGGIDQDRPGHHHRPPAPQRDPGHRQHVGTGRDQDHGQ